METDILLLRTCCSNRLISLGGMVPSDLAHMHAHIVNVQVLPRKQLQPVQKISLKHSHSLSFSLVLMLPFRTTKPKASSSFRISITDTYPTCPCHSTVPKGAPTASFPIRMVVEGSPLSLKREALGLDLSGLEPLLSFGEVFVNGGNTVRTFKVRSTQSNRSSWVVACNIYICMLYPSP